jgi:hypothetical protein
MTKRQRHNANWKSRLAAFQASGKTQTAWCEENNVKLCQLRYQLRKASPANAATDSQPHWLSMEVDNDPPKKSMNSLCIRVGSATIEVRSGFDRELLADTLRVLATIC